MVASGTFAEFLREQLAPLGRVTMRRMFGRTGVFLDGAMFGMLAENTLHFRVDARSRAVLEEATASWARAALAAARRVAAERERAAPDRKPRRQTTRRRA
jgi:DNA transformation protein